MLLRASAVTKMGINHEINEDSHTLMVTSYKKETIILSVVCDGVSTCDNSHLASKNINRKYRDWFRTSIKKIYDSNEMVDDLKTEWNNLINEINKEIIDYGKKHGTKLASTMLAALFIRGNLIAVNVGDSRLYKINNQITQVTKDQTLAQYKIDSGELTEKEANSNKKYTNTLIMSIGTTSNVEADFYITKYNAMDSFLVCTDGIYKTLSNEELLRHISSSSLTCKSILNNLIEKVLSKKETDDITGILIKILP